MGGLEFFRLILRKLSAMLWLTTEMLAYVFLMETSWLPKLNRFIVGLGGRIVLSSYGGYFLILRLWPTEVGPFRPKFLLVILWFRLTEWEFWSCCPSLPSPDTRARSTGRALSPWLVKIARALKVMVIWHLHFWTWSRMRFECFYCQFSERIDAIPDDCRSFSTHLKFARQKWASASWWEGVSDESWATTRVLFPDWKIRRLNLEETPVSGDDKVQCMKYHSSSPYFWPYADSPIFVCCGLHVLVTRPGHGGQVWGKLLFWGRGGVVGTRGGRGRGRVGEKGEGGGAKAFHSPQPEGNLPTQSKVKIT